MGGASADWEGPAKMVVKPCRSGWVRTAGGVAAGHSALYCAKPGEVFGPEDLSEGWMASKVESQLAFEGSSSSFQALEEKIKIRKASLPAWRCSFGSTS